MLMCTASVTTILGFPHTLETTAQEQHPQEGAPLLTRFISHDRLHDCYIGASVTSFFVGGIALGLSAVTNCVGFLIPLTHLRAYVVSHSYLLGALPSLTVTSGGCLGLSIVIGVDMEDRGRRVLTQLTIGSFVVTTVIIATAAFSGHAALVKSIVSVARHQAANQKLPWWKAEKPSKRFIL